MVKQIKDEDMTMISLWVNKKDYEKFKVRAVRQSKTVSEIVREFVKNYR